MKLNFKLKNHCCKISKQYYEIKSFIFLSLALALAGKCISSVY